MISGQCHMTIMWECTANSFQMGGIILMGLRCLSTIINLNRDIPMETRMNNFNKAILEATVHNLRLATQMGNFSLTSRSSPLKTWPTRTEMT